MSKLETAESSLSDLLKRRPKYTREYFENQWNRQRDLQSKAISESVQDRTERLGVLLELEEQLFDARCVQTNSIDSSHITYVLFKRVSGISTRMDDLNVRRVAHRTGEQRRGVLNLPGSLATLEKRIQDVAVELGSQEFLQLTGHRGSHLTSFT